MKIQNQLAISYIRFSAARQSQGDSVRRQTEATQTYCTKHGLTLTDAYRLQDSGVSAFRGANLDATSALGQLLKQVEAGKIPQGTVLIVENLDRLSRDKVRKALTQFLNLIDKGIEIVALSDNERRYNADSVDANSMELVASIMVMSRAHEESLTKSNRIKASWINKGKLAAQGKHIDINCPDWLNNTGSSYVLIPDKAAVVKKVFKLYLSGYGSLTISNMLNADKTPTVSTAKKVKSKTWHPYQISRLLNNKAVIGTYTFVNPEVPNYYPAAVTEADYYAAQAKLKQRVQFKGQRTLNPYVFSHLMKCSQCGSSLFRTVEKGYSYIQCMGNKEGSCKAGYMNYPATERALLNVIATMDSTAVDADNSDTKAAQKEIDALTGRIAELDNKIANASEMVAANPSDAGFKVIQKLESDRAAISKELEQKQNVKYLTDYRGSWKDVKAMLEKQIKEKTGNSLTVIPVTVTNDNGKLGFIRHEDKEPATDVIALRETLRGYINEIVIDTDSMKVNLVFKTGKAVKLEMKKTATRPIQYHYKTGKQDWIKI